MKIMQEMIYPSIEDIDGLAKCLDLGEDQIHRLEIPSIQDSSCFLTPEDSPVSDIDSGINKGCKNGDFVKSSKKSSLRLVPIVENGRILFKLEVESNDLNTTDNETASNPSSTSPMPPLSDEDYTCSAELQNYHAPVTALPKQKKREDSSMTAKPAFLEDHDVEAASHPSNKTPEPNASRVQKNGPYQEVVKAKKESRKKTEEPKVSSKTALEFSSLDNNDLLSKALFKVLGSKTVKYKIPGTDSVIVCSTGGERGESIGSTENPIQVLQQGNMYYSLHSLRDDQLNNLCSVIRDNHNTGKKNGNDEKNQTNTRIVYKVMQSNNNGHVICDDLGAGDECIINGENEKPIQRTRSGRVSKRPRNYEYVEDFDGRVQLAPEQTETESRVRSVEAKSSCSLPNESSVHKGIVNKPTDASQANTIQTKTNKAGVKKRRVPWQRLSVEEREVRQMDKRRQSLKELCRLCSKEELLSAVLPSITPLLSVWQFVLKKSEDDESGFIEPQSVLTNINSLIVELKKVFQLLCRLDTNSDSEDPLINLSENWETVATGMHYGKYLVSADKWVKYTQQQLEDTVCRKLDDCSECKPVETPELNSSEKRKRDTIENEPNKRIKPDQEVDDPGDILVCSLEKPDKVSDSIVNGQRVPPGYVLLKVVNEESRITSNPASPLNGLASVVNKPTKVAVNRPTNNTVSNAADAMSSTVSLVAVNQVTQPVTTSSPYQNLADKQAPKAKSKKAPAVRNLKPRKIESKNVSVTCISASSPIGNLIPIQTQVGSLIPSQSQIEGLISVQGGHAQSGTCVASPVACVQNTKLSASDSSSNQNNAQMKQVLATGSKVVHEPVVCVQNGNISLAPRYSVQGKPVPDNASTGRLSSYIPVTCIQQPLINMDNSVSYILQNTYGTDNKTKEERLQTGEMSTRNKNVMDNCIRDESERLLETTHQNAQVLNPVLLSNGSPVHFSRRSSLEPSTTLPVGPTASLSIEPATSLSIGPATPLSIGPATPLSIGPPTPLSIEPATTLSIGPATPLSIGPGTPLPIGSSTPISVVSSSNFNEEQNVTSVPCNVSNHYVIDVQSLVQAKENGIVSISSPINGVSLDTASVDPKKTTVKPTRKREPRKSKSKVKAKKSASKVQPLISQPQPCSEYLGNQSSSIVFGELVSKALSQPSTKYNVPGLNGTPSVTFTADAPISTIEIMDKHSGVSIEGMDTHSISSNSVFLPNKHADTCLDKFDDMSLNMTKGPGFITYDGIIKVATSKSVENGRFRNNVQLPFSSSPKPKCHDATACVGIQHGLKNGESLIGSSVECMSEEHKDNSKTLPTEIFPSAAVTEILKVVENERATTFSPPVMSKSLSAELLPLVGSLDDSSLSSISDILKLPVEANGSTSLTSTLAEPFKTNIIQTSASADQYPSCTTPSSFTAAIDSMATKGGDLLTTMSENSPRLSTPPTAFFGQNEVISSAYDLDIQKHKQKTGERICKRRCLDSISNQHIGATGLAADPCINRLKKDVLSQLCVCHEVLPKNDPSRVAHAIYTGDFSSEDSSTSLFKTLECNLNGVSDKLDTSNFSSLVNDDSLSSLLGGQGSGAEMEVSHSQPSNSVPYWHDNAMIDIEDILTTSS